MKLKTMLEDIVADPEIMLEGIDISLIEDLQTVLTFYLRDYDYRVTDAVNSFLNDLNDGEFQDD